MNLIALIGRIGKEPEYKMLDGGTGVATFSLAVTRPFKDKKTDRYEADWFEIECYGKTADFVANHCSKGRMVAVTGSHRCRKYQDQNGNNRVAWEVKADKVQGVGPAPNNDNQGASSEPADYSDPFGDS